MATSTPSQVAATLDNERSRRAESFANGYMPPEKLVVDPSLHFHTEADTDLDPVSYEVLRSKLWNVNWDHQETIRRVSGSQVVVYGYDFNTTIQTEDGAGVCFGPGNLFFGGCADVVVKWTLEHRSMNVGINEGDIFLQDDPWIGTNHQMDAAVYAPVFHEGKLFAWVYNVIHQRELGGVEPGGFTQQAHDVYAEPTFFPPMKLVDAGKVREDVVDAWVRRSRLAGLMTLELRSQIAGVELARARLLDLVERYGAECRHLSRSVCSKFVFRQLRTLMYIERKRSSHSRGYVQMNTHDYSGRRQFSGLIVCHFMEQADRLVLYFQHSRPDGDEIASPQLTFELDMLLDRCHAGTFHGKA